MKGGGDYTWSLLGVTLMGLGGWMMVVGGPHRITILLHVFWYVGFR